MDEFPIYLFINQILTSLLEKSCLVWSSSHMAERIKYKFILLRYTLMPSLISPPQIYVTTISTHWQGKSAIFS